MTTLDDAWRWYDTVTRQAKLARRLAANHWDSLPWDAAIGRDPFFRDLESHAIVEDSQFVTDELDDLAVLVLFSVFEAIVREAVLAELQPELKHLKHPSLKYAAREACDWIKEGSFFRVLEPFKLDGHADLIEQVNQVRRYRNWVAHGRRGEPNELVTPRIALDRLRQFLSLIQLSAPTDPV